MEIFVKNILVYVVVLSVWLSCTGGASLELSGEDGAQGVLTGLKGDPGTTGIQGTTTSAGPPVSSEAKGDMGTTTGPQGLSGFYETKGASGN